MFHSQGSRGCHRSGRTSRGRFARCPAAWDGFCPARTVPFRVCLACRVVSSVCAMFAMCRGTLVRSAAIVPLPVEDSPWNPLRDFARNLSTGSSSVASAGRQNDAAWRLHATSLCVSARCCAPPRPLEQSLTLGASPHCVLRGWAHPVCGRICCSGAFPVVDHQRREFASSVAAFLTEVPHWQFDGMLGCVCRQIERLVCHHECSPALVMSRWSCPVCGLRNGPLRRKCRGAVPVVRLSWTRHRSEMEVREGLIQLRLAFCLSRPWERLRKKSEVAVTEKAKSTRGMTFSAAVKEQVT